MSTSLIHQKVTAARAAGSSRLIPGQAMPRRTTRKRPHAASVGGTIRVPATLAGKLAETTTIADRFLPAPFAGEGRWEFWSAMLADHVIILTSWTSITFVELLLRTGFSTLNPPAGVASQLLGSSRVGFALLFSVIATFFGYSEGLYYQGFHRERKSQVVLAKSIGWATLLVAVSAQLAGFPAPALGWLLLGALASLASLLAWKHWRAKGSRKEPSLTERSRNVLIVGAGTDGREVASYFERRPETGRIVRGFLDECNTGFGVLGSTAELAEVARAHFIDEIT